MSRKIGLERSQTIILRIPGEWWRALTELADVDNPPRELIRAALLKYLVKEKKVEP